MTLPDVQTLIEVVAATWPAAARHPVGPWVIRDGQGGGQRVSAATASGPVRPDDLAQAEAAMRALGQTPLVMLRPGEEDLDQVLAAAGYVQRDITRLYAAPVDRIATRRPPPVTSFQVWPPLAIQAEFWAAGGIGPARLAVMERAPQPKTSLLGRLDDQPAGTVYVGSALGCAMIHALEIAPGFRRRGLAGHLTRAAAFWARDQGLAYLSLAATQANEGAHRLYTSLGLEVVGQYHYRVHPEG